MHARCNDAGFAPPRLERAFDPSGAQPKEPPVRIEIEIGPWGAIMQLRMRSSNPGPDDLAARSVGVDWYASALFSQRRVSGLTHETYRYPARFSPDLVRAAVGAFSAPGDYVLDPFLGGGTTAVEALAAGRRVIGFDVNELSLVLTRAKTMPLRRKDLDALDRWLATSNVRGTVPAKSDPRLLNAPEEMVQALRPALATLPGLPAKARDAARAVLLQAGQWAIDGREHPVSPALLLQAADRALCDLKVGLLELSRASTAAGVRPGEMKRRRVLRHEAALDAATGRALGRLRKRARLVVTSPPYPGVHVLYHRWQVRGRVETAMPYWIADAQDGEGPNHYTMGGRSRAGIESYFEQMLETWQALRLLLAPGAFVVQLIAFSDPGTQHERYLQLMERAGYALKPELSPTGPREVPNRKWYYRAQPNRTAAGEVLLVHTAP
jgi:DNA methylase